MVGRFMNSQSLASLHLSSSPSSGSAGWVLTVNLSTCWRKGPTVLVGNLSGLPEEAQDQGGWSKGRWAQLKNPELLLGFEDTSMGMSLRTFMRPLGRKMPRPEYSCRAKDSLILPTAGVA